MIINEKIDNLDLVDILEKYTYKTQSYMNILCYLIDKKIPSTDENFQYYENKYLEAYFQLEEEKANFQSWLQNKYNLPEQNFNWHVDFITKKVKITIKEEDE